MNDSINSTAPFVEAVYANYVRGKYIVNRRYQRKLVWTIEEKRAFIDSLIKRYSVPLILFAKDTDSPNKEDVVEILDGLQRMNAIFSFMENEFGILMEDGNEYFFDLMTLGSTKAKCDNGEIEQRKPTLDIELCRRFTQYPLPVSEMTADNKSIEEVFRRINSFGRKLSKQEIRQAGALGQFPDMVRIISSEIRGDVSSSDILPLSKMSTLSLSSTKLKYGIDIKKLFWTKQNIIPDYNVRISRDEELIASILTYILLGANVDPSAKNLDKLYCYNPIDVDSLSTKAEESIRKLGFNNIVDGFIQTYDLLQSALDDSRINFQHLVFGNENSERMFRSFQVIYLAIYDLFISNNLRNVNKQLLIEKLTDIGKIHLKGIKESRTFESSYRHSKIVAVKAVLEPAFSKLSAEDVSKENWTTQLENLLTKSQTEGTQYDFKTGIYNLEKNATLNKELVKGFVKRLAAMANKGPNIKGFIIIGVSENKTTADRYEALYQTKPKPAVNTHFYINGIQDEVNTYYNGSFDNYERELKKIINSTPVEDQVKIYITTHMKNVDYYGKSVIVLELEATDAPVLYEDKLYIRSGNDLEEITGFKGIVAINEQFKKSRI